MSIAHQVAARSTCPRRAVGAVLVMGDDIAATGYNGAPKGLPHCDLHGCSLDSDGHCIGAVHAEVNTIAQATRAPRGATLYVTTLPCRRCMGLLINAGIARIVYAAPYADATHADDQQAWVLNACNVVGIDAHQLESPT